MVGMRRHEFVTQRGGGIPILVDRVEKGLEFLAGHRAVPGYRLLPTGPP